MISHYQNKTETQTTHTYVRTHEEKSSFWNDIRLVLLLKILKPPNGAQCEADIQLPYK